MIERARDPVGNDGTVTYWPDHFAQATWFRCLAPGCETRVDPWDHNTRCTQHRPPDDHRGDDDRARRLEVARAIVAAHRESVDA
jgi:hypothetical protein